jgi:thiosulfate/3-mercaptopyruvate sulfurtransferase
MSSVDTVTNPRLRGCQGQRRPLGWWGVVRLVCAIVCGFAVVSAPPVVPAESAAFVHPNLIVSVRWLMQHTTDPNLRLVDARPTTEYDKGHIPGAVSLPVADTFDPAQHKNYPDTKEKLETLFASRGLSNTTRIITYDNGKDTLGPRLFWTLEYVGATNVAVLHGGLKQWQAAKGEISSAPVPVEPGTFVATVDPARLPTAAQCTLALGDPTKVILDARSPQEFRGEDVRAKYSGHIPGAVNIDWRENFQTNTTLLKDPVTLKTLYESQGVTPDKEVIAHCQTGQRSSVSYWVLRLLGYPKVGNYAGSWVEWGNDPTTPKAQGN